MSMQDDQPQQFDDDEGTPEPRRQQQTIEAEVLADPPQPPLTKGALATMGMDALDRNRVGQVKVSAIAGGVAFASALEVMEFAKLMAVSQMAVPKYLRNNPGMCLAITFQAVEWRMSPFAVANKSYAVNDRIGYESQLVHAVIEARAPLRERLDCRYEGDGPDRACTIIGKFRDGTTREYTTPKFKDIRVKNSPLWKDDPDQQHFYYGSRSWSRKWCPDVLLGIYTREELAETPMITEPGGQQLIERLKGADTSEGHKDGHTERELSNVASDAKREIKPAAEGKEPKITKADKKKKTEPAPERTTTLAKPKETVTKKEASQIADRAEAASKARKQTTTQETDAPAPTPATLKDCKNAADYQVYAMDWIDKSGDPEKALERWDSERDARDDLVVRTNMRNSLRSRLEARHGV